ncbi:hypothetical protein HYU50_02705 [Candidatus Woesearchaeota archaeon]|nr:hypothetical protein [Candidatus Woesearchaeota archaeon]
MYIKLTRGMSLTGNVSNQNTHKKFEAANPSEARFSTEPNNQQTEIIA